MSSSKNTPEAEKTRAKIRGLISARSNTGSARGAELFVALRKIFKPHEAALTVVRDEPGDYSLNTRDKAFFGGVRAFRSHTSVYLAPLFADPKLLESVSPALQRRIEGNSFVFKTVESPLIDELTLLTTRCLP